jgi:hypothetical protein
MATDVDICNLALLRIGTRSSIGALNEGSVEANACARLYPLARDTILAEHPWSFAAKRASLALVGDGGLSPWSFRYAYPPDCLPARAIGPAPLPIRPPQAVAFEVAGDTDAAGHPILTILTDQAGAVLLYTAQIANTGQFPPRFIEALSWKLAAELVSALTGEAALGQAALAMAEAALTLAKTHDGNEGLTVQQHDSDWVRGREFLPLDGRMRR